MPTNEERQQIAGRLRKYAPIYRRKGEYPDMASGLVAITGTSLNSLFYRLADLIEPEERTVNLTKAIDAICGEMCGDGWDWSIRAETVVRTVAEMCGAKVVE